VAEQPPYSILTRAIEADLLPTCARYGMGVISYSPLAGGWLTGRFRKDAEAQRPFSYVRQALASRFDLSLPENQHKLDATGQLAKLADEAGITLIEMAIAFVLRHTAHRPHRRSRPSGREASGYTHRFFRPSAVHHMYATTAPHRPTVTHPDTQRDKKGTARQAAFPQRAGRFRWWWQVLGSNQGRLSRRFYSTFLPAPPRSH
jgi:hypothetical protein